jgi:hypothetical protein
MFNFIKNLICSIFCQAKYNATKIYNVYFDEITLISGMCKDAAGEDCTYH